MNESLNMNEINLDFFGRYKYCIIINNDSKLLIII